jgi:hypothetical protein
MLLLLDEMLVIYFALQHRAMLMLVAANWESTDVVQQTPKLLLQSLLNNVSIVC